MGVSGDGIASALECHIFLPWPSPLRPPMTPMMSPSRRVARVPMCLSGARPWHCGGGFDACSIEVLPEADDVDISANDSLCDDAACPYACVTHTALACNAVPDGDAAQKAAALSRPPAGGTRAETTAALMAAAVVGGLGVAPPAARHTHTLVTDTAVAVTSFPAVPSPTRPSPTQSARGVVFAVAPAAPVKCCSCLCVECYYPPKA